MKGRRETHRQLCCRQWQSCVAWGPASCCWPCGKSSRWRSGAPVLRMGCWSVVEGRGADALSAASLPARPQLAMTPSRGRSWGLDAWQVGRFPDAVVQNSVSVSSRRVARVGGAVRCWSGEAQIQSECVSATVRRRETDEPSLCRKPPPPFPPRWRQTPEGGRERPLDARLWLN